MSTTHRCLLTLVLAAPLLAQGQATFAQVTPAGLFYQQTNGPVTQPGNSTDSPTGLRWTYPNPNWITAHVSVGNHGTMAWLGQELNFERYSLLSTTDNNPPSFIFEPTRVGTDFLRVKAADKAPFAVTATVTSTSTTNSSLVEFWSCYSATPIWTLTVNFNVLVDISENGQMVALAYTPSANTSQVDVYDAFAGPTTPIATLTATSHSLRNFDLSDDGSTVLIASNTQNHVFDVATQTQIMQASTVSHDAHAISRDGSAWGRGGFNPITAWVKTGSSYNQVLNFTDTTLGFAVYAAAGISADGTTFAAAAYDANNTGAIRVCCWDLTPTGSTLLWSFLATTTGNRQNTPQAVSVSDDGSIIAVGSWGEATNATPEVMIFARNGTGTPIAFLDTPGSCYDLDLSGDGQFLVVGTKSVHANVSGRGGEGYSFDLGGQSLFLNGAPSIGRNITLSTEGANGELVILGFAAGVTTTPIMLPGVSGELMLDLTTFLGSFVAGVIPAGGVLQTNLAVPNIPLLVGNQFVVQGLHGAPFTFTNIVRLPFTP